MFLEAGRDIAAMSALDERLSHAREEYIEQVLSGRDPDDTFWPEREAAIVDEIKRRFFSSSIGLEGTSHQTNETGSKPSLTSPGPDDSKGDKCRLFDFNQHSQKLLEYAIWMTHEITKHIPYVGQKEYVRS